MCEFNNTKYCYQNNVLLTSWQTYFTWLKIVKIIIKKTHEAPIGQVEKQIGRERRSLRHWPTVLLSHWHHNPNGRLAGSSSIHVSSSRPLSTLFPFISILPCLSNKVETLTLHKRKRGREPQKGEKTARISHRFLRTANIHTQLKHMALLLKTLLWNITVNVQSIPLKYKNKTEIKTDRIKCR